LLRNAHTITIITAEIAKHTSPVTNGVKTKTFEIVQESPSRDPEMWANADGKTALVICFTQGRPKLLCIRKLIYFCVYLGFLIAAKCTQQNICHLNQEVYSSAA